MDRVKRCFNAALTGKLMLNTLKGMCQETPKESVMAVDQSVTS